MTDHTRHHSKFRASPRYLHSITKTYMSYQNLRLTLHFLILIQITVLNRIYQVNNYTVICSTEIIA